MEGAGERAGSLMGTMNKMIVGQVPSRAPGRGPRAGGRDEEEDSCSKDSRAVGPVLGWWASAGRELVVWC